MIIYSLARGRSVVAGNLDWNEKLQSLENDMNVSYGHVL